MTRLADDLRIAASRERKRNNLNRSRGIAAAVPADRATRHVRRLVRAGMPPLDIAQFAGLGDKTITQLAAGRYEKIYRTTETAILLVPAPGPGYRPTHDGYVSPVAARRRLQALSAVGFPLSVLADQVGTTTRTICDIRRDSRGHVRNSLDLAIRRAYDKLWNADPIRLGVAPNSVSRARAWARKNHWALPAAWDDDRIDDPAARPETGVDENATVHPVVRRAALRADDIRHLNRCGVPEHEIAARVGVTVGYVRNQISGSRRPGQPRTRQAAA